MHATTLAGGLGGWHAASRSGRATTMRRTMIVVVGLGLAGCVAPQATLLPDQSTAALVTLEKTTAETIDLARGFTLAKLCGFHDQAWLYQQDLNLMTNLFKIARQTGTGMGSNNSFEGFELFARGAIIEAEVAATDEFNKAGPQACEVLRRLQVFGGPPSASSQGMQESTGRKPGK